MGRASGSLERLPGIQRRSIFGAVNDGFAGIMDMARTEEFGVEPSLLDYDLRYDFSGDRVKPCRYSSFAHEILGFTK